MIAAARSGRAPGSRTSPACSTPAAGPRGCGSSSARSARIPELSCGSPTSTAAGSPPWPPTVTRPARRPGTTASETGQVRGPDPLRQGHRPAEPAAQGLRAKPDLVRDRLPGLRTTGLDADARARRPDPALGTQAPAPAPLYPRRTARLWRPPPAAAARRTLALGRRSNRCHRRAASPAVRLTSPNRTSDQEGETTRDRGILGTERGPGRRP